MFCFLMYLIYSRKYYDGDIIHHDILTDLHALSSPGYGKVAFGIPFVCVYVCVDG